MKKKVILLAAAAAVVALTVAGCSGSKTPSVGFIDMRALQESINSSIAKSNPEQVSAYMEDRQQIQSLMIAGHHSEAMPLIEKVHALPINKVFQDVYGKIGPTINAIAKKRGFDVIEPTPILLVTDFGKSLDITKAVLDEISIPVLQGKVPAVPAATTAETTTAPTNAVPASAEAPKQ